ncbi:hypothetical protein OG625_19920 [Streptomyces sp. NBC_01351]|nr:hypothetical protein [Streptomyces sp. NBC_01351]
MRTYLKAGAAVTAVLAALVLWFVLDNPLVTEPEPDHKLPRPTAGAPQ